MLLYILSSSYNISADRCGTNIVIRAIYKPIYQLISLHSANFSFGKILSRTTSVKALFHSSQGFAHVFFHVLEQ